MASKAELLKSLLRNLGLLTDEQLEAALNAQRNGMERLGLILVKLGLIANENIGDNFAPQLGLLPVDISSLNIPTEITSKVPGELASQHRALPIKLSGNTLTIATDTPFTLLAIPNLERALGLKIDCVFARRQDMNGALQKYYGGAQRTSPVDFALPRIEGEGRQGEKGLIGEPGGALLILQRTPADALIAGGASSSDDAPIIKLVGLIIEEAHKARASDIHIEPLEDKLRIRYRIDGILHEVPGPPKTLSGAITSRLKIMASMDIAEKRLPQDGRIQMKSRGKALDIRASSLPAVYGESIVMRLLDKTGSLVGLDELGFLPREKERFEHLINIPNGMILVTGPTGSGKTTTLYAALSAVSKSERKTITVEDPVEYQLSGINQVQVKPQIDLTFANTLRAMLRQSPDIIMVGEIRDTETASIAMQAALTGHLIFSTLHTNDAPSAVTRLIDMGIPPYLVASTLQGVLAQRLVRKICQKCKKAGCVECSNTGYKGRIGIFELLIMTDELREMIFRKASATEIQKRMRELGMTALREDGLQKVRLGITTLEEVYRVTQEGAEGAGT